MRYSTYVAVPFAARPSLDKLSFDMAEEEDTSPGRTEKDVMYLGGEIGLLDDDGSQLRPVEEPGTDPEPWKVFTPLSYEPGRTDQTESVLERPPKSAASGSNKARSRPKPAAAAAALESTKGRTSGIARESKALKTRLASLERGGGAGMPRRMGNRHNASLRRTVPRR